MALLLPGMDMRWVPVAVLVSAGYVAWRVYRAMFQNWRGRRTHLTKRDVIDFMNYGIALELEQVEFYRVQEQVAERLRRPHLAAGMRQARRVEARHVRNLAREIRRLGGRVSPATRLGSPLGQVVGRSLRALGGEGATLRAMVGIEQKAIDHYLRLIHQLDDPQLKRLFMEHLVDEEFHAAWAQEMIVQARNPRERDKFLRL